MIHMVIDQPKQWAGRWPLDLENEELTTRELGWIKRFSGYLPLTMGEGLAGGDAELFAAYAVIALVRAGTVQRDAVADVFDRLIDQPFGATLRIEADEEEQEGEQSGPPTTDSSSTMSISGDGSNGSSEGSADLLKDIGTQGSASSEYDLRTLAN